MINVAWKVLLWIALLVEFIILSIQLDTVDSGGAFDSIPLLIIGIAYFGVVLLLVFVYLVVKACSESPNNLGRR
jgi:hypothetical protein